MDGTEEQKRRYLPRLASGELISSFALTEPEAEIGRRFVEDLGAARRRRLLNGTKRFITNAPHAGLFTVFARTDASQPGAKGVSAFLVEAQTPGLSLGPVDKKMGQRGSATVSLLIRSSPFAAASPHFVESNPSGPPEITMIDGADADETGFSQRQYA